VYFFNLARLNLSNPAVGSLDGLGDLNPPSKLPPKALVVGVRSLEGIFFFIPRLINRVVRVFIIAIKSLSGPATSTAFHVL
jgi:hypothetical protein